MYPMVIEILWKSCLRRIKKPMFENIGFFFKMKLFCGYINGITGAANSAIPYSGNADIES